MPTTALIQSLTHVRRKVKLLSLAYGAGIVVACVVGALFLTSFLDWCFDLPGIPRLLFCLAAIGVIGWAGRRWIVKPSFSKLSLSDVAGHLENAFPEFGDRLRSTVDFTRPGVAADMAGSRVMKDRVINEATAMAQRVDLSSALVWRPVMYSVAGGLAAVIVMVLIGVTLGSEYVTPAINRLVNPFGNWQWPKRTHIVPSALPSRVPMGAKVNVSMKLTKGDKPGAHAIVYYQYDNGPEQMVNMNRDARDGAFVASLDARGESLKVWMKSGDDETAPAAIAVVPRLAIANVSAVVAPPKYAAVDPYTVDLSSHSAMVTYGSQVTLKIAFNKPLDPQKPVAIESVRTDQPAPLMQWDHNADAAHPTASWNARESLRFRVRATDTDGFSNTALEEYELLVTPDQPPRVVIEKPTEKMGVTPEATVRLQIRAEDDFNIKTMTLMVARTKRADKAATQPSADVWSVPLSGWDKLDKVSEFQPFRLNYAWDLPKLKNGDLQPGDSLEYWVQVTDNFELDGQTHAPVSSRKMELAIISQKDLEGFTIDKLRQVSEEVAQVQRGQKNTQEATKQIQQDTKDKPEFSKADREVTEKRVNDQSALSSQTRSIAQRVQALKEMLNDNKSENQELKDLTNDVKDSLERAADEPMKKATDKLNEANRQKADPKASKNEQQKGTDQRNDALAQAQQNQQQASDQLQQALDRMKNIGTLQKAIESVQKLLEKQQKISNETAKIGKENLGKKPEEMSKEAREAQEKNAKEQSELSKETQKTTDELGKTAEQLQRSDQATSEAMKQAQQQSQQQNVPQKQQQAADQEEQNQQSQAQANQKQAELGLQMMLDTLREAERRKLEKLVKQLDDAIKSVENLVRQQAGHNIDNLMNQGGDKVKLVSDELLAKAKRVRDHMPPFPGVAQLTGLQEQTERNTSDVLKTIGDLQGGAEAAANLNRASTKMGYAIVSLRDKKLAEAYDPHQTEALAALDAALDKLREQKQKAQDKIDQTKKEKLREVYVKIRDDQVKLNDRTTKLDKAKLPDGTFKHADQIDLGKLPGEQGGLVDRIKKVGQDLAGISIVYQWANTDIEKSMAEVKDDLAKPELGQPTQAEQTRVVDQLNAMIDNLKVTPPDQKKFADKQNGNNGAGQGQAGQQKRKLPGEAELRLLKDLQVAVNKSTTKIDGDLAKANDDKAKQSDKQKIASLGGRQGELRDLLDQLLKQSSGKGLSAKPDKSAKLPEEASNEKIEDDELEKQLLQDKPNEDKATKDIDLVGDRMARSQSRLSDDTDPGKTTQKIQERIVMNMDDLIAMAQQQQQMQRQRQPGKPEQGPPQPDQNDAQAQNQGNQQQPQPNPAQQAAKTDQANAANENDARFKNDLKETAENWGQVSPRLHDAVVEGASEKVPEKYRSLVQDYYRSLATKATERK